jgi:peptidoglycan/xylan/chitin deacetylase (PgdA/CDA1 family)/glycosyltransferase involved in cell wall biosynthesis
LKLSVLIATYNRRATLVRTLPTLFDQDFPADQYEVIVIVDGSTDGTTEFLRSLKAPCAMQVLEQPNRGQFNALNAGLRMARGDIVLQIDDDILCDRGLIRAHVAAHDAPEPRFVVGPVLVAPESPDTLATDWTRENTDQWLARLRPGMDVAWQYDATFDANCSVSRAVMLEAGGFDERFKHTMANLDFGVRLWKMGVRFRYEPAAVTSQVFVKPSDDLVLKDAYWTGRNLVPFCRKHPECRTIYPLAQIAEASLAKRLYRTTVARLPFSIEPLMRPAFRIAERSRSIPSMRRIGLRLLTLRQGIVMVRSAVAAAGSWDALRREFAMTLPVLMYHHIGPLRPGTYPELTVSPPQFESHISWLARHGYSPIRTSDWMAWVREAKPLPAKPVLITIDDGYADVAEFALPILKRHGFTAVVYVVTSQIGGTNAWDEAQGSGTHRLMSAEQIRDWTREGIEFAAHTRTHPDLRSLAPDRLEAEIAGSADDLAELTGERPASFAYPYGYYSDAALQCAGHHFALAMTCDEGLNTLATRLESLRRVMIYPTDSMAEFAMRVRLGWSPIQHLRARLHPRARLRAVLRPLLGR